RSSSIRIELGKGREKVLVRLELVGEARERARAETCEHGVYRGERLRVRLLDTPGGEGLVIAKRGKRRELGRNREPVAVANAAQAERARREERRGSEIRDDDVGLPVAEEREPAADEPGEVLRTVVAASDEDLRKARRNRAAVT